MASPKRRAAMVVALALAGLHAAPALAQPEVTPDWRAVSFIGQGEDEGLALLDTASLRRTDASVREIRTATVMRRPDRLGGGRGVVMAQVVYRFDCKGMTYAPVRTESWSATRRLKAGDNDGPVRTVETGTIMAEVRRAVCNGAFGNFRKLSGANPVAAAQELIGQRQSLIDSRAQGGWQRLMDSGDAPDRLLYFAARGSVIDDRMGRKVVSTMVLIEKPEGGISRIHYLVRVDCKARTGETLYAEAFGDRGQSLSEIILDAGPQPLEPGRMAAALEVPVCRGDWNTGAPEVRLPDQLAREAFK